MDQFHAVHNQETSYTANHVEPRVKLYSPREESFSIPLKYIEVSRTTHTILDVMQERRISDYWNIDGPKDVSDSWTSFSQFTLSEEKPPDGYTWSGGGLQPFKQKQRVITCGQKFRPVCSKSAQRRSSNGLTRIRSSTMRPSIAQYGFGVDPDTCSKFRPHPIFFIPSSHLV